MMFFPFIGKLIALAVAALIGLTQGALLLGDPGAAETLTTRLFISAALALAGGAFFGYNFRRFWFLAVANAWAPLVFIALSLMEFGIQPARLPELGALALPVIVSAAAGWLGAKLRAVKNFVMLILIITVVAGALFGANGYVEFTPADYFNRPTEFLSDF